MPVTPRGIVSPNDPDNWDLIVDLATMATSTDAAIGNSASGQNGTAAQRTAYTASAPNGFLWQDTDGAKLIWRKDGAVWVPAVWRWSGTGAQMSAFAAPNGFEWFNTTDGLEYIRFGGVWGKTTGSVTNEVSGSNIVGIAVMNQVALTGVSTSRKVSVSWSPINVFSSTVAVHSIGLAINATGTAITTATTPYMPIRVNFTAANSVISAPGGTIQFNVPAGGAFSAGLILPGAITFYGSVDRNTMTMTVV